MRENLFLHFLNRDSREIFGLFRWYGDDQHIRLLRKALNAAMILCEDYCIMPPGFVVEDDMAFGLAEAQIDYLAHSLLRFPMRESNIEDYAACKLTIFKRRPLIVGPVTNLFGSSAPSLLIEFVRL